MNRTLKDPLSKVAIYGSVSVDGFIADENDLPRPKGWDPEAPFVHSAAVSWPRRSNPPVNAVSRSPPARLAARRSTCVTRCAAN